MDLAFTPKDRGPESRSRISRLEVKDAVPNSTWMQRRADDPYMIGDVWDGTDDTGCVTSATICEAAHLPVVSRPLVYIG